MTHLPRLFKILNVIAKYRLDEFFDKRNSSLYLRLFFKLYGLPWAANKQLLDNKNKRLRKALEELGPIYIKFGQLLSTRRDFLQTELADELKSLQDKVPPFEEPSIDTLIHQSLDSTVDAIFSELNRQPMASASVAQVYSGKLHGGDEVVIKVIRPGIENTIAADIKLLKWIARIVETRIAIGRRLRTIEVVDDYEKVIFGELDLMAEAANASQLRRNFENSDVLYVPKVYWDYTRENIMVTERIYGIPVADIASLNQHNINLKRLAETGVEIFFTQVFQHSFFHADMHPGNIFVAADKPHKPQYIAVDCAIIGSLDNDDQQYLAKNLLAIFKQDYRRVAELHVECGWVPPHTSIHEFESAMRSVCEPIFEKPIKDISFGNLLVQLFRTAGRFDMEVQPSLVLLQKTLLNIEGLGRQLYPELDLWQTALPYLEKWNRKRLSPLTLAARIHENAPQLIEQLPQLPQMLIDSLTSRQKLNTINMALASQQKSQQERWEKRRRHDQMLGFGTLIAALITLVPPVNNLLTDIPSSSLFLAAAGLYFLYFRR